LIIGNISLIDKFSNDIQFFPIDGLIILSINGLSFFKISSALEFVLTSIDTVD